MDQPIDAIHGVDLAADVNAAESGAMPKSSFAVAKWRGTIVLLGLAPWILYRCAAFLPRDYFARLPIWFTACTIFGLEIWSIVFPLAIACRQPGWKLRWPRFGHVLREVGWSISLTIGLVVLLALVNLALVLGGGEQAAFRDAFEGTRLATELPVVYLVFLGSACTLAPLGEEITMRGMVYNALKNRMPVSAAVLMQAALFAGLHTQPLVNIGAIFLIGTTFALIYERRGTLLTPVLVHMLLNTLVVALLLIDISQNAQAPILGVYGEDRTDAAGCVVTAVVPESAAAKAGLQVGDAIFGFDAEAVTDYRHLVGLIRSRQIGEVVTIKLLRDGALQEVKARLARRR